MKKLFQTYFLFSRKELIACVVLVVLMVGFLIAPSFFGREEQLPEIDKELEAYLSGNIADENSSTPAMPTADVDTRPGEMFFFDPNTASVADLVRLGISATLARRIANYRTKGGQFRKAADISKIWGMPEKDAARLMPYVRITSAEVAREQATTPQKKGGVPQRVAPIDINTADLATWQSLPGIGEALAARIVRFRERMGGFTSPEQIRQTYGLSDTVFARLRGSLLVNEATIPRVSLNTATAAELKNKLGLSYKLANAIIRLRETQGPFRSVEALCTNMLLPDSVVKKLELRATTE